MNITLPSCLAIALPSAAAAEISTDSSKKDFCLYFLDKTV
jgi:hypothetical protein